MTTVTPPEPATDMIARFAALMATEEVDWAERGRSMARSTLLLQANRLEEMAATDDLTLLRQAKDDDAAYAAFRQYFLEHLPHMAASESEGGRSKAMLAFLRGDVCERREMLLGIADLLKQLAEQPMDAGTLDAAVECMKRLSPVVRI